MHMKRSDISDLTVCKAAEVWNDSGLFMDALLVNWTGAPIKVVYAAMSRAYGRGLLECGVSLRTAWLTDSGKALLASEPRD